MDNIDIKQAIADLCQICDQLETAYVESGGEVTDETEVLEDMARELRDLLNEEGVDSLGRWLRSVEDSKKNYKAEKDFVSRKIDACDKTIDYIKGQIAMIMKATGRTEPLKGKLGYSFAPYLSTKTSVNKDVLNERYADRIEMAIRDIEVPSYVTVTLSASVTKAKEVGLQDEDSQLFITTQEETVKFTKPRKSE